MKNLSVALVEPFYEINVGYVARIMKNFGIKQLILINPRFELEKARRFASHGVDVLEHATESDLDTVRKNFNLLIGTSAITGTRTSNLLRNTLSVRELPKHLHQFSRKTCLLLGRDTTGLTNSEMEICDILTRIGTGTNYWTLNISHALAIILYEISDVQSSEPRRMATSKQKEFMVDYTRQLAELAGLQPYKNILAQRVIRQLAGRGLTTHREASILIGLLRRGVNALRNQVRYA